MILVDSLKFLVNELTPQLKFSPGKEAFTGDDLKWFAINELSEFNIGICDTGYWGVEGKNGIIILNKKNSFWYLISLLERPKNEIVKKLVKFKESIETNADIISNFPFCEIVRAGFEKKSDYWSVLAFKWYDGFSIVEKKEFLNIFLEIVNSNWASQKVKQKAQKELSYFDH